MADVIFFDLDGTLVDSLGDIGAAMNFALLACGFPPHPLADYRRFVGEGVDVLARVGEDPAHGRAAGRIVAVRQGPLMATSFHPEVGGDGRVHRLFVDLVNQRLAQP
jgi:glutamine amidotransferase PdxT